MHLVVRCRHLLASCHCTPLFVAVLFYQTHFTLHIVASRLGADSANNPQALNRWERMGFHQIAGFAIGILLSPLYIVFLGLGVTPFFQRQYVTLQPQSHALLFLVHNRYGSNIVISELP